MKIYVVTHKKTSEIPNKIYSLLQVGSANNKDLGYLKDNVGDNISKKNPYYCELTGLYWIWKNSKEDIVGLCHYRRYFFESKFSKSFSKLLCANKIKKILKKYDIIVPLPSYIYKYSLKEQYIKIHHEKDLLKCRNIIKEMFPEYIASFDKVFQSHSFYPYNMFITSKIILDEYCEWLFKILFELENEVDITNYDSYNQRIFGFLSERLLNVWLDYKKLKVKKQPVHNIESNLLKEQIANSTKKILLLGRR